MLQPQAVEAGDARAAHRQRTSDWERRVQGASRGEKSKKGVGTVGPRKINQ